MEDLTGHVVDDELAIAPLAERGWAVETIPWTVEADWDRFDVVVPRSTWDYQGQLDEFLGVLSRIDASRALLQNPLELIRWNANKGYLLELSGRGVPTPPTELRPSAAGLDLERLFERFGAQELVIKPVVGAGAVDIVRVTRDRTAEVSRRLAALFADRPLLVQPFLAEVVDPGEHSLVYFGGRFSHAVLKTPRPGDFRVQEEHGGRIVAASLPRWLIEAGRELLASLGAEPLYARVDLVRVGPAGFLLMELELIEPSLYLRGDPGAAERFAEALVDRFARRPPRR